MTLTAARWFSTYVLKETSGKSTQRTYEQSTPADDAAARVSAAAMATDLQAVTDSVISAYWTYQMFEEDTLVLPAAAENQNQALLSCGVDNYPAKTAKLTIPAPKKAIMVAETGTGFDVVDTVDAEVVAFFANFDSEALFYVSDGEQADGLLGGKRRHVGSSNS